MRYNVLSALILHRSPTERAECCIDAKLMASVVSELRMFYLFSLRCGTVSSRKWPCGAPSPLKSSAEIKNNQSNHIT